MQVTENVQTHEILIWAKNGIKGMVKSRSKVTICSNHLADAVSSNPSDL